MVRVELEERWLRSLCVRSGVTNQDHWWAFADFTSAARYASHRDFDDIWLGAFRRGTLSVAIVVRPHRLFAVGDVVLDDYGNGQAERWAFSGYSTKVRAAVRRHYLRFARWDNPYSRGGAGRLGYFTAQRTPQWQWLERGEAIDARPPKQFYDAVDVKMVLNTSELPDDMRSKSACDPTVRAYVLDRLRAVDVAPRVSTDSPGPL